MTSRVGGSVVPAVDEHGSPAATVEQVTSAPVPLGDPR